MTAVTEVLLGVIHKRRPQSGERSLSSVDILRTRKKRGSSDANVCTFCCKKTSNFLKFVVCHLLYYCITVSLWLKLSLLIADIKIVTVKKKKLKMF